MTNPFTHDPLYRRVKDAALIILALYSVFPSLKEKVMGTDMSSTTESCVRVLQVSVENIDKRLSRLEDKIDRMSYWQRREREEK